MCGAPAATDHQSRSAALEVLRALIREGGAQVDVRDADGRTPLLWAASAGSAAAVLALHQSGAKVDDADRDGLTALHCAAARGHTEALETLVGLCGARVDVADSHGCTPLHYAAALGHADATSALLQHGADSHRQDRRGRSPAHTAAAKGQIETIRILGARGTNLWLRNSKGDLPLHEAVASGRRELVKWLLDGRPSQVNATNHEGRTPLHVAAATDNADLCRLLLDRGAEVNPVTRSSKNEPLTPLDCATSRGHRSTAKYLQMHGGLPATKLANTEIIIDGAPITALPTRKVTSTKIDVRDRIRIEKREVVELSSPLQERRRAKDRQGSLSSSSSSGDRKLRTKADKYSDKYPDRRKRLMQPQSFSDGYDSELDTRGHGRDQANEKIRRKGSKKSRSKSEPSERRQSKRSSKNNRHFHSDSGSSSESESYFNKRKGKSHRKRSKRQSTSTSESSSSESTERRSTKRKGKNTSIHIEHDKEKQSVNIIKYKCVDNTQSSVENKSGATTNDTLQTAKIYTDKEVNQVLKSKTHSETETDTVSIKTNMIVTEAQIHVDREPAQLGTSKIHVKLDSSNNVSIETANLSVAHRDLDEAKMPENCDEEPEKEALAVNNDVEKTPDKDCAEKEALAVNNDVEKTPDRDCVPDFSNENELDSQLNDDENKSEEKGTIDDSDVLELANVEEPKADSEINKKAKSVKESSISPTDETKSAEGSLKLETERKRSFQVLLDPEHPSTDKETTSVEHPDAGDSEQTESKDKSSSVSFANLDEVYQSKDLDKLSDHPMGEEVVHSETGDQIQNDTKKNSSTTIMSSEEKRKEYASTTASSSEFVQSTEKGLITVIDENIPKVERAVQQIIMESLSEEFDLPLAQSSPARNRKTSKDSQVGSRKGSIYETESYKVLSNMPTAPDGPSPGILKKSSKLDDGSLEENQEETFDHDMIKDSMFGKIPSVSDNELYSHSEANGRRKRFRKKGRTKSRMTVRSKSENSERGYESSGMMDSGFEPSPRAIQKRIMSPRLAAYYQQRNASGRYSGKFDSRIPVRKPGDKHAVDMKSVTQRIQTNMRRYYCERKIFHHLLELKRLQIRTSKAHEAVLVKRAIEEYNQSSLSSVGLGPYNSPDYSFSSFEKFLYESLRKLQKSGKNHLENLPLKPIDFDYGESELYKLSSVPDNPCLCTSKTHRCFHAVHAYTGIPCSAYIPYKWNHHTMPKPATAGLTTKSKGFLPKINAKPPPPGKAHVTLEVSHGTERQLIALPAEKLDKNKRYYVTFTVKGSEPPSDNDNASPASAKNVRSG